MTNVSDDDDDWEIGVLKRFRNKSSHVGLAVNSDSDDDDDWQLGILQRHGKPMGSLSGARASSSSTSSAAGPRRRKTDGQDDVVDLTQDNGGDSDYSPPRVKRRRTGAGSAAASKFSLPNMTDQEQLELALKMSMKDQKKTPLAGPSSSKASNPMSQSHQGSSPGPSIVVAKKGGGKSKSKKIKVLIPQTLNNNVSSKAPAASVVPNANPLAFVPSNPTLAPAANLLSNLGTAISSVQSFASPMAQFVQGILPMVPMYQMAPISMSIWHQPSNFPNVSISGAANPNLPNVAQKPAPVPSPSRKSRSRKNSCPKKSVSSVFNDVTKVNMKPSRSVENENCPNERMFRTIESHFLRQMTCGMAQGGIHNMQFASIKSIDIVTNETLIKAFEKKQEEFKARHCKKTSHEIIYAYHGTNPKVIDQILQENFDMNKALRQAHGRGNYFSEFPSTALNYSHDKKTLIFCKILPGKQYKGRNMTWEGHDSKLVDPDKNDVSQMVIIQNKDQILPCGVIHF